MIREHFEKHKTAYCTGGLIVIAGITYYIARGTRLQRGLGISGLQRGPSNTASFIFGNQTIVNTVDRQGPPSWVVENVRTHERWLSQRATAIANNCRESDLSAHLNGLTDDVNGEVYRRLGLAIA
jgi:hypothetical protein